MTMGKVLDELIDKYLGQVKRDAPGLQPGDDLQSLDVLKAAKNDYRRAIYEEFKRELTEREYQSIREAAQERYQQDVLDENMKNIRNLILQGILVAFLVGLDVNQLTNLYDSLQVAEQPRTLWAIGILSLVLLIVVLFWMVAEVCKLLRNRK